MSGIRIGKDGSGSNIPKFPGTGVGSLWFSKGSDWDRVTAAIGRGVALYTVWNANPNTGEYDVMVTKDLKKYQTLTEYARELGLSDAEKEEIRSNVEWRLQQDNALFIPWGYDRHFVACFVLCDDYTVLHKKTSPYPLRAQGRSLLLHVNKHWQHLVLSEPWSEAVTREIASNGELVLYGENDVSISLAASPEFETTERQKLFEANSEFLPEMPEVGALLDAPSDLIEQINYFDALYQEITPPGFGTFRLDDWPQKPERCRMMFIEPYQEETESGIEVRFRVHSYVPDFGSFPGNEGKNVDPADGVSSFFAMGQSLFPGYRKMNSDTEDDWTLAVEPKPVCDGGIGPVRPGFYYKDTKLVAIMVGSNYGYYKGSLAGSYDASGEWKASGSEGIVTNAMMNQADPQPTSSTHLHPPMGFGSQGPYADPQCGQGYRYIRHYFREASEIAATVIAEDWKPATIEFRITLTIRTGTRARLVSEYPSTSVVIEGMSHENHPLKFKANIGTKDEPNEVTLEQRTNSVGKLTVVIPLDQGLLETEEDLDGRLIYSPFQEVSVRIVAAFENSSVIGSFMLDEPDRLEFDTYVPYTIKDISIRDASGYLPRG